MKHGTRGARNKGCTCGACRAAHAEYMREWRYKTGRVKYRLVPIEVTK